MLPVAPWFLTLPGGFSRAEAPDSILVGLLGWVTLAYLIATVILAMRGSRPPHDLWAKTDVVFPGSPR